METTMKIYKVNDKKYDKFKVNNMILFIILYKSRQKYSLNSL